MRKLYLNNKVIVNDIKEIQTANAQISKFINKKDNDFYGFGELYGSIIKKNEIKAWKMQKLNTMNIFVLIGSVKFVFSDKKNTFQISINSKNNKRITVLPGIFYGFKGLVNKSMVINLINNTHDEKKNTKKPLDYIDFNW